MKTCRHCGSDKPLSEYHSNGGGTLRPSCRACERVRDGKRHSPHLHGTWTPRRSHERVPMPATIGRPITVAEIYWIAGFLEGEGYFHSRKNGAQVSATQVQREPLERLQRLVGGGIRPIAPRGNQQPSYFWRACGRRARGIMLTVYSVMSPRRKGQILKALHLQEPAKVAA